jgi:hypothetical protein
MKRNPSSCADVTESGGWSTPVGCGERRVRAARLIYRARRRVGYDERWRVAAAIVNAMATGAASRMPRTAPETMHHVMAVSAKRESPRDLATASGIRPTSIPASMPPTIRAASIPPPRGPIAKKPITPPIAKAIHLLGVEPVWVGTTGAGRAAGVRIMAAAPEARGFSDGLLSSASVTVAVWDLIHLLVVLGRGAVAGRHRPIRQSTGLLGGRCGLPRPRLPPRARRLLHQMAAPPAETDSAITSSSRGEA